MALSDVGLSLLDRSRTREGEPDERALAHTITRARRAEDLGYARFWVAEHHGVPGIASGSPPVLMAAVAARTERIRVGSGGVMLPNHQPIVVAEQLAMLQALHPGRIDLGVGRSLGFTAPVRDALRAGDGATAGFEDDLRELREFLSGTGAVTVRPSVPPPPVYVLATGDGLDVAARAGLPVVVGGPAVHDTDRLQRYRDAFVPHDGSTPRVLVSLDVMVADTEARARDLLLPEAWAMAASRDTGIFEALRSVAAVRAIEPTERQRRTMRQTMDHAIAGDPDGVRQQLEELLLRADADELLASTSTHDLDDLAASDAALARLLSPAGAPGPARPAR